MGHSAKTDTGNESSGKSDNKQQAEQHKQRVTSVFNDASQDYDNAALRFFPFTADRMVDYLQPHPGWKILDVATGTGALAIALAQAVGNEGRVMGIDLSEGMLARAESNIKKWTLKMSICSKWMPNNRIFVKITFMLLPVLLACFLFLICLRL